MRSESARRIIEKTPESAKQKVIAMADLRVKIMNEAIAFHVNHNYEETAEYMFHFALKYAEEAESLREGSIHLHYVTDAEIDEMYPINIDMTDNQITVMSIQRQLCRAMRDRIFGGGGVSGECEHPYYAVIGDGELKPARCLKCGKYL